MVMTPSIGSTPPVYTHRDLGQEPAPPARLIEEGGGGGGGTQFDGNRLLSGGEVAFVEDFTITVSAALYLLQGVPYGSGQTTLTADAADPTNDRIDSVVVTSDNAVTIVKGTPAVNPLKPNIDPLNELELTFFVVEAGATELNVTTEDIYQEGVEWTPATNAPTRINLVSTSSPYRGTVDVELSAAVTGDYFEFVDSAIDPQDWDSFVFYIENVQAWNANRLLSIQWMNGSTPVGNALVLRDGLYTFSRSLVGSYQQVVIPVPTFSTGGTTPDRVRFTVGGSGGTLRLRFDACSLQSGLVLQIPNDRMRWTGPYNATRQYVKDDVVFSAGIQYVALQASVGVTPTDGAIWQQSSATPGVGAVTSVGITAPAAGITVAGSPITSSGNMTLALADDLAAVEGLAATGIVRRTAANTWSAGTAVNLAAEVTGTLPVPNGGTGIATTTAFGILFGGTTPTGAFQSLGVGTAGQALISGGAGVLPAWTSQPFAANFMCFGLQTEASQFLGMYAAPAGITTLTAAAALAGSSGKSLVAATAQTDIDVRKNATTSANGTSVGTIRWAAAGTVPTFIAASGFTLTGGTDYLSFWGPATADATLANFGATLYFTRV